ncbi:MAG TPA: hypothetical protein PLM48_09710, partial [Clostridia bacterium]|nr:hypothetical protein [Clostridia bacterium]
PVATAPKAERVRTLSALQYFFLTLLYHVPVVGTVFLFVWGCGRPRNSSLHNYSLFVLILRLVAYVAILALVLAVLIVNYDDASGLATFFDNLNTLFDSFVTLFL